MKATSYLLLLGALALGISGARCARAQEPVEQPVEDAVEQPVEEAVAVALFPTAAEESPLRELAKALDPIVLSELGAHAGVEVSARPPLDLPATQLALDCIGETVPCLQTVAKQAGARALLSPSLERAGDETVVTLLYFDAQGEGSLRSAVRRHRGEGVERAALDAVPAMLSELLGREPTATASHTPGTEPLGAQPSAGTEPLGVPPSAGTEPLGVQPSAAPDDESTLPTVPLALGGAGAALLGVGIAFGLMSEASEDDYAAIDIKTERDVDAAREELEGARTQALIANLGIGVGVALIGAALITFVVGSAEGPAEASAWLSPSLAPGELGLSVHGRFEETQP